MRGGPLVCLPDLAGQVQPGGVVAAGLIRLAVAEQGLAEAAEHMDLAGLVADLPEQGERLTEVAGGLPVAALPAGASSRQVSSSCWETTQPSASTPGISVAGRPIACSAS